MPTFVGVTFSAPEVACVPLQAPDAVQLVAPVVDQFSDAEEPKVMGFGETDSETVGGLGTVSFAELLALPPLPVHVNV